MSIYWRFLSTFEQFEPSILQHRFQTTSSQEHRQTDEKACLIHIHIVKTFHDGNSHLFVNADSAIHVDIYAHSCLKPFTGKVNQEMPSSFQFIIEVYTVYFQRPCRFDDSLISDCHIS